MNDTQISLFTIDGDASVEMALQKFEDNNHATLIVIDDNGHAIGSITDGDIRKALIDHRLLNIPVRDVMNTDFLFARKGDEAEASEVFKKHFYVRLLPVVDDVGLLCGIVLREEIES